MICDNTERLGKRREIYLDPPCKGYRATKIVRVFEPHDERTFFLCPSCAKRLLRLVRKIHGVTATESDY